ncbi:DUF2927 domain-containing protein [Celeribacter persicus]|uniref:ATP-dependent transcriptional regulator n=1 Tax=Celeribacter persicus TaxID=1651082 RepID=A0A2T5HBJ0_9RHOB|nr:DUF2927 domain-containing protein [Celeribacter persicus]PTQ68940.1 Protein of unknown function (DUF2927) [Celeribacter persicus]
MTPSPMRTAPAGSRRGAVTHPILRLLVSTVLLAGCMSAPSRTPDTARAAPASLDLPPMKIFSPAPRQSTSRSNASIARDFLDLSFALETGATLDRFTRFEGPITLRITGERIPASLGYDLSRLMDRFRTEAGIEISRVAATAPASITIETLTQAELSRRAPNTACIVVPNVSSWQEFRHARRASLSWTQVERRERLAVFIPENIPPQEIRDCLHEELAQALGPLNDLYRLPDSVFNDDNIHSVLTSFDMLILRATYAPELRSGMTRAQVAAALPGILDRIHPAGVGRATDPVQPTPPDWTTAALIAMGDGSLAQRRRAAEIAVTIARHEGWSDTRAGFSWFLLGRLAVSSDRAQAHLALDEAYRIYAARPETRFHAAHVAMQRAALALSEHRYEAAYEISASAIDAARDAENAALLASLMLTESEALAKLGRTQDARSVRLDSLGWARYGFGSDEEVRARAAEIAALAR